MEEIVTNVENKEPTEQNANTVAEKVDNTAKAEPTNEKLYTKAELDEITAKAVKDRLARAKKSEQSDSERLASLEKELGDYKARAEILGNGVSKEYADDVFMLQ